jgi:hypothetical protein
LINSLLVPKTLCNQSKTQKSNKIIRIFLEPDLSFSGMVKG